MSTDETRDHAALDQLLHSILERFGYDFTGYSRAFLLRRARILRDREGLDAVEQLTPQILDDREALARFLAAFSIPVTEMFRDPGVFRTVREAVLPYLRTWPFLKLWHAGCATGEEAYSMAIVLAEEDLLPRSRIYATDMSMHALAQAREGIYDSDRIKEFTANYQHAGGTRDFSSWYRAEYGRAILDRSLKERMVFAAHNLATDAAFGEMQLVLCRNVLIYMTRPLQDRVLTLLTESLAPNGFLCLGTKETLRFSSVEKRYRTVSAPDCIFQKLD